MPKEIPAFFLQLIETALIINKQLKVCFDGFVAGVTQSDLQCLGPRVPSSFVIPRKTTSLREFEESLHTLRRCLKVHNKIVKHSEWALHTPLFDELQLLFDSLSIKFVILEVL